MQAHLSLEVNKQQSTALKSLHGWVGKDPKATPTFPAGCPPPRAHPWPWVSPGMGHPQLSEQCVKCNPTKCIKNTTSPPEDITHKETPAFKPPACASCWLWSTMLILTPQAHQLWVNAAQVPHPHCMVTQGIARAPREAAVSLQAATPSHCSWDVSAICRCWERAG